MLIFVNLFMVFYPKIPYLPDYVPQSLILILIGAALSAVLKALSANLNDSLLVLSPELFFNFLLPPIVLDSSYGLYNRTFSDFLASIIIYAVLGTLLNFFIIAPIMYGLQRAGAMGPDLMEISLNNQFLFSAVIVAVDPVAVLAIFQETGVNLGLYYVVFGESLLNDAVTVVLYEIMCEFTTEASITPANIGLGVGSFFTISLGGMLIGLWLGALSCILTRWKSQYEAVFLIFVAYLAYFITNCVGWSGIIAMINCGLIQASYAFHNISHSSLATLEMAMKQIAEISEAVTFFLLGFQILITELQWSTGFCLWAFAVCSFARAVVVIVLTEFINFFRINNIRIYFREQLIMIYGGLRGAVAFSLAFLLKDLQDVPEEVKRLIITCALFVILVTVGFQGLTMRPLVHLARIELDEMKQLSIFTDVTLRFIDHTLAGIEAIVGSLGRNRLRETIFRIDTKFIRRVLQRSPQTPDDKVVKIYEQIALKLHLATVNPEASAEYLHDLPSSLVKKYFQEEIAANSEVLESKDEEVPFGATTASPPEKREPRKQQLRRISRTSAQLRRNPELIRPVGMISDHGPINEDTFKEKYVALMRLRSKDLKRSAVDDKVETRNASETSSDL
ncbi:Sodium/hydrogen exchanger 2 [Echinococcus granulosus]|nr:Sodium/hydrogen exchanger 2 [Echinococcus granulosus]